MQQITIFVNRRINVMENTKVFDVSQGLKRVDIPDYDVVVSERYLKEMLHCDFEATGVKDGHTHLFWGAIADRMIAA